jgi:predicted ArsR family transcriptional regulator
MATVRSRWLSAVAALGEPTRRRLYEHVVAQAAPVGRDEVAAALGLPRQTAAFHLDRLAAEGLLDVGYERRTGRSGPGAGRPAKLYRRSAAQVTVSLPERRYDLAGEILAAAIEESERTGQAPREAAAGLAFGLGAEIGASAGPVKRSGRRAARSTLVEVLTEQGFEPATEGRDLVLRNCPFHRLAQAHTELVCGMNLQLLAGLLSGLADTGLTPRLDPAPGRCCVRFQG